MVGDTPVTGPIMISADPKAGTLHPRSESRHGERSGADYPRAPAAGARIQVVSPVRHYEAPSRRLLDTASFGNRWLSAWASLARRLRVVPLSLRGVASRVLTSSGKAPCTSPCGAAVQAPGSRPRRAGLERGEGYATGNPRARTGNARTDTRRRLSFGSLHPSPPLSPLP